MRLLVLLTTCTLLFSTTSSFNIDGMMCGAGCVKKIKKQVGSMDGVQSCEVNFEKGTMLVEYDELKLNDEAIIKQLTENTTYTCSPKKEDEPKKGLLQKILGWF